MVAEEAKSERRSVVKRLSICMGILIVGMGMAMAQESTRGKIEDQGGRIEVLERNIRLDFQRIPLEGNDLGVFIVTASPWFKTTTRFSGESGAGEFNVSGKLELRDDGRIFVVFEADMAFQGNGQAADFHVRSTVLLQPGQELGVSRMGDKTLVIRASYVDPTPAAE